MKNPFKVGQKLTQIALPSKSQPPYLANHRRGWDGRHWLIASSSSASM
jgi:hypothetical protein